MTKVSMTKARQDFTNIANRVMFGDERICIEKNNKAAFALVPVEDVEILEALEDQIDVQAAKAAIKKGKFIDLEALAKQLGV
ncbi:MAG: type II toxin-antitoxin system Phd/YefM family antitoxin [Sedimentisphaerales bacterium]|jgi:prevent-host-death family protein|nr:type II toxin-antitoxin system Phd/YefM family antitoxin [Sedimentisphaerales bacterium]